MSKIIKSITLFCLCLALGLSSVVNKAPETPFQTVRLFYTIEDRDANGVLCSRAQDVSHSYVIGFLDMLYCQATNMSTTITDTGGVGRTSQAHASNYRLDGPVSTDTYGILVGSGTNAVAITDTALQTKITTGTGAGQLSYGATTVGAPFTVSSSRSFTITRTFTNGTASTITINEIGFVGLFSSLSYKILLARDLVANGQAVTAGHSVTITYTVAVSV